MSRLVLRAAVISFQRIITGLLLWGDRLFAQLCYLTVCGFRNQSEHEER